MRIQGMLIALLLAGLTLFTGCSEDDPVPKMPKTSAAAPTPSPTTSPTPQSEADEAEALIRQWAELNVQMQATGETSAYEAITADECETCRRLVRMVGKLYAGGGQVDLQAQRVVSVRKSPRIKGSGVYEAKVDLEPSRVRQSPEDDWKEYSGGRVTYDIDVVREHEALVIREIVVIP